MVVPRLAQQKDLKRRIPVRWTLGQAELGNTLLSFCFDLLFVCCMYLVMVESATKRLQKLMRHQGRECCLFSKAVCFQTEFSRERTCKARALGSNEQRRGVRDIGHVLVGFGLQQHLHNFKMTHLSCNEGGSGEVVSLLVTLCTRHQQEGRSVLVAILACNIQWRCVGLQRQVDFGPVLHQEFDCFLVAVLTCNKEGRSTKCILGSSRK